MAERSTGTIILWFFLALFLISTLLLGWLLWPFVSVIVLGAVVTSLFRPVYRWLLKKMRPVMASSLTCLLIFLILFVPTFFMVGILSKEAYGLYQMGKNAAISEQIHAFVAKSAIFEDIKNFLSQFNIGITGEQVDNALSELGKFVGLFLYQQASAIASNILKFFAYFFCMLLIIYFLLIDGDRLIRFIVDLSPLPREQEEKLIQKFNDMASAVLVGNGLTGLIQGILGGLVFELFGLKSPFLWGVIMALLAFLPIFGIGAVFVPTAVLLFLKGRVGTSIFFLIFYCVLSFSAEYLFKPKLVGKRAQMHTLLVFFAIIGGLKLFGILGIIYGPLIATAFLTLTDIYYASYQRLVDPPGE